MKKIITLLILATITFSMTVFSGCENKDKVSISNKEKIKKISLPQEKDEAVDLTLYFDTSKNEKKVEIAKEERIIQKEELIGELIMQELIKGPSNVGELKPILPKETKVLSFSIKEGVAYINLSKEARVAMTAQKEEACLKSIVNSLTQLPSIIRVKIKIEDKDIDTLGGNFDLSKPLGKDDIDGKRK